MCGLYGFLIYGDTKINRDELTESLAVEAAVRGTDATGIAYNSKGRMTIYKKPKSAYDMKFRLPKVRAVMGHTRHATQGDVKDNFNNHPFFGRTGKRIFALAHNGVLMNDIELRQTLKLPETKIDTDSYIAVQLIESQKQFNIDSIRYMAEKVSGSYSFSILDDRDNIYLVKGDSPLCILHFPQRGIYVYASTSEILWKGIVDTALFDDLKDGKYEEIRIDDGDILKLCADGAVERSKFVYHDCFDIECDWRRYRRGRDLFDWDMDMRGDDDYFNSQIYIDDLKSVAAGLGYTGDDIDTLLEEGFLPEEIEEYLYCGI